jgi:hypothetical protein
MIDTGLLLSIVLVAGSVAATIRLAPPRLSNRRDLVDAALGPAMMGLLAGRLAAIALGDRNSLTRPADVLVLRGGVEFWPGLGMALLLMIWASRQRLAALPARLADGAPYALVAYAAYEATCLVRSGCFGPSTSIGLAPPGIASRMLPIGIFVAVAVVGLAAIVRRSAGRDPITRCALAIGGLAAIRTAASVWLPKIGSGPTRQHLESIAVLVITVTLLTGRSLTQRLTGPSGKVASSNR